MEKEGLTGCCERSYTARLATVEKHLPHRSLSARTRTQRSIDQPVCTHKKDYIKGDIEDAKVGQERASVR